MRRWFRVRSIKRWVGSHELILFAEDFLTDWADLRTHETISDLNEEGQNVFGEKWRTSRDDVQRVQPCSKNKPLIAANHSLNTKKKIHNSLRPRSIMTLWVIYDLENQNCHLLKISQQNHQPSGSCSGSGRLVAWSNEQKIHTLIFIAPEKLRKWYGASTGINALKPQPIKQRFDSESKINRVWLVNK